MWILVLQYMTFVHFFVIALGKLCLSEGSVQYFRSQCNDDIYLLFALIALGKASLREGSGMWNSGQ
jgi:hypothetical protein